MAITAYTGLQGSGKSYQVVSHVIINALRQGRVVVTNIQLDSDLIREYLAKHGVLISGGANGDIPGAGGIVQFTVDQLLEDIRLQIEHDKNRYKQVFPSLSKKKKTDAPDSVYKSFFPRKDAKGNWDQSIESIVQPGDLVVIDEAWEFWETGMTIPLAHHEFFRYHRHFKSQTGQTCDIVMLSQHVSDLHAKVKNVIEMTILTEKLVELGASNSFRISSFSRVKLSSRPISVSIGRYNPLFFKFYKSHDAGVTAKAKERRVDKRQLVWNSPFFKYVFPLAIVLLILALYLGYSMFNSRIESLDKKAKPSADHSGRPPIIAPDPSPSPSPVVPASPSPTPNSSSGAAIPPPVSSSSYNVHGYIKNHGDLFVLLDDNGLQVLLLNPPNIQENSYMRVSGTYKGTAITSFNSPISSSSPLESSAGKLTPANVSGAQK